jgi:hypothetical protein
MNIYGLIFMLVAWGIVAGCTAYCFWKQLVSQPTNNLTAGKRDDNDMEARLKPRQEMSPT